MKQHRIICIPTLTFALLLMFTPSILQAQDKPVFPIDSLMLPEIRKTFPAQ